MFFSILSIFDKLSSTGIMRVVSMNSIQQRYQTSKGTHCLMFVTTWTCTISRLRPIPMILYHYFRYENKGGGVKRVKKIANVDEVPA